MSLHGDHERFIRNVSHHDKNHHNHLFLSSFDLTNDANARIDAYDEHGVRRRLPIHSQHIETVVAEAADVDASKEMILPRAVVPSRTNAKSHRSKVIPKKKTIPVKRKHINDSRKTKRLHQMQHNNNNDDPMMEVDHETKKNQAQLLSQRRRNVQRFLFERLRSSNHIHANDSYSTNRRQEELIMMVEHLLFCNQLYQNDDDLILTQMENVTTTKDHHDPNIGNINIDRKHQEQVLHHHLKYIMCHIIQRKLIQQQKQQQQRQPNMNNISRRS